jgi:TolA-binding protein
MHNLILFPVSLMIGSGCSNITMLRIAELKQVEARVDSLRLEMTSVQSQMLEQQKQQGEILRAVRADQSTRFGELERNISALVSGISENQDRLSRIDEKTQEIKKRYEEQARTDSLSVMNKNAEAENLMLVAQQDFSAGRYLASLAGLDDVMKRHPGTPQAESAAYWTAECHYVQKAWDAAEAAYKNYIKSFSTGAKVCAALYKLGLVYEKTDKKKSQDMVWEKLLSQCSESEEAQAVRSRKNAN